MAEPIQIPRYIDDPVHFLLWTVDDVAPIGFGLMVGMFVGSPLTYTAIGWMFSSFYKKFRDRNADGFVLHFLYWQGLTPSKSKRAPNPFKRKFLP